LVREVSASLFVAVSSYIAFAAMTNASAGQIIP
jgi:hypothetical protein